MVLRNKDITDDLLFEYFGYNAPLIKKDLKKFLEDFSILNDSFLKCENCEFYKNGEIFYNMKFCYRLKDSKERMVGYQFSPDDFCSRGRKREN